MYYYIYTLFLKKKTHLLSICSTVFFKCVILLVYVYSLLLGDNALMTKLIV